MTLVFELPLPPNMANGRMHWRVKANRKKLYFEALDMCVFVDLLPKPPEQPIAMPVAEIEMRTARRMDHDNAHARLKWPLDWLQSRGYIVNDRDLTYTLKATTTTRAAVGIGITLREVA